MKKVIDSLKYIKISDLLSPFIFICALPFAFIFRIINIIKKRKLWLICEDGISARDNGYYFYKYIRNNYPNDFCFYVIDKKSPDFKKVKDYGNIIQFNSFKHWIYYLSATFNISNQKSGNPNPPFFYVIHVMLKLFNNRIFLQHGVIKDDLPFAYYKNARFRLFICSTPREYEYVKDNFGYPENYVINTGLARFDGLHNSKINKKQILFMPTWRNWLREKNKLSENTNFKETDYYKYWNSLLNNQKLINYIEKNNIEILFYPHINMRRFLKFFNTNSKNIKILDTTTDIQTILKSSALMVTDYSSVFMDFAYMGKPTIYYQFDQEEFRKRHLTEGYFSYENDAFGPIIKLEKNVVDQIIKYIEADFKIESKYVQRINIFFTVRDTNNCKRTYDAIKEIE